MSKPKNCRWFQNNLINSDEKKRTIFIRKRTRLKMMSEEEITVESTEMDATAKYKRQCDDKKEKVRHLISILIRNSHSLATDLVSIAQL